MAHKYPICDVFHWFCKIARFFATEPFKVSTCPFFIICMISIPFKVLMAVWKDWKPNIGYSCPMPEKVK